MYRVSSTYSLSCTSRGATTQVLHSNAHRMPQESSNICSKVLRVPLERQAPPATATVRDATFDVLRRLELTTIFSNPGSTEVPLLAGLPDDLDFVLALHEGSVVGMAAGHALGRGRPSLVLLHSTPGLGNSVAALATA